MREEATAAMARYQDLPMPERPRGTEEQKIDRLYSYLWQLVEQLNNILHQIAREAESNGKDRN